MKKICIGMINMYQKFLSPILTHIGCRCKFYPTCSEYTKQAINKYPFFLLNIVLYGIFLGIKRILKCNPLSKGGYDPIK